jgi:iron-sulfur cluster repair protein YtfE (RIC family)
MANTNTCGCHQHDTGRAPSELAGFTAEQTVAEVSRRSPAALDAIKKLGLNHCCGAHLTLAEAAASAGVPLNDVLAAVNASPAGRVGQ